MIKQIISLSLICFMGLVTLNAQNARADKKSKKAKRQLGYKIGDTAEDFKLKNVDNNIYSLASLEDVNGYIVIFTSNECPFAVAYEDRIIQLHNDMVPIGYPVVAINSNDPAIEAGDSFTHMQTRASEKEFPFLYLDDKKQKVYPKFGASKTPHVFLLDQDRVIRYIGAIDDNAHEPENVETHYLRDAIAALERGDTPNPNTTKAVGCPIKTASKGNQGRRLGAKNGPPSADKILDRMDENNDMKISSDEAHGPLKRDFVKFDTNGDGYLTVAELKAMKTNKPKKKE